MRHFKTFRYKNASYRIAPSFPGSFYSCITKEIIKIRTEIEEYILVDPNFLKSFSPISVFDNAPEPVALMQEASQLCNIGPMAAVAGTIAMLSARRTRDLAMKEGLSDIVIENGGDIFILPVKEAKTVITGIFSGLNSKFNELALKVSPTCEGLAVCSSSGTMGHSFSFGKCDLCTVISKNAALADAAATYGGNLVKDVSDLEPVANRISCIDGVIGVILIKNDRLAMAGKVPEIVFHKDEHGNKKITKTF